MSAAKGPLLRRPAGAGKSHFVVDTIGTLRAEGFKVAVVAPTNEQVHSLVQRITVLHPGLPVSFVHAKDRDLLAKIAGRPGVSQPKARDAGDQGDALVAATIDKLADAHLRDGLGGFDVLIIDEAYQADAARYYTAAAVAPTQLLVGDSGQLDPFSTLDDPTFWRAEEPRIRFRPLSACFCATTRRPLCTECQSPDASIPSPYQ